MAGGPKIELSFCCWHMQYSSVYPTAEMALHPAWFDFQWVPKGLETGYGVSLWTFLFWTAVHKLQVLDAHGAGLAEVSFSVLCIEHQGVHRRSSHHCNLTAAVSQLEMMLAFTDFGFFWRMIILEKSNLQHTMAWQLSSRKDNQRHVTRMRETCMSAYLQLARSSSFQRMHILQTSLSFKSNQIFIVALMLVFKQL